MRSLFSQFGRAFAGLVAVLAIAVVPAESSSRTGGDRGGGVHVGSGGQGGHTVRRHKRGGHAGEHRRASRLGLKASSAVTVRRADGVVRYSGRKHRHRHLDARSGIGVRHGYSVPAQSAVTVRSIDGLYIGEIHVRRGHHDRRHHSRRHDRDRDLVLIRKINPWLAEGGPGGPKIIRRRPD